MKPTRQSARPRRRPRVERDAADKAERERQAKEAAAIKEQKALEAVYDPACAHIFRLTSHEKAFRDVMLSDSGKRFIPKRSATATGQALSAKRSTPSNSSADTILAR